MEQLFLGTDNGYLFLATTSKMIMRDHHQNLFLETAFLLSDALRHPNFFWLDTQLESMTKVQGGVTLSKAASEAKRPGKGGPDTYWTPLTTRAWRDRSRAAYPKYLASVCACVVHQCTWRVYWSTAQGEWVLADKKIKERPHILVTHILGQLVCETPGCAARMIAQWRVTNMNCCPSVPRARSLYSIHCVAALVSVQDRCCSTLDFHPK